MKWRSILSRASLPMLALAASHGVYSYALLYAPVWVAFVQAAAFELVYIGLAVAPDFDARQQRRAAAISGGAVVASVVYNTLAGLFHRIPLAAFELPVYGELAFAALHGLPLAWVAYLVADLMLHARTKRTSPARHGAPRRMMRGPLVAVQVNGAQPPAVMRALPAEPNTPRIYACVKCGASVEGAAHRSASGRFGCKACKEVEG